MHDGRQICYNQDMAHHICPWYVGYFLLGPLRRIIHDPEKILRPYVLDGMTALDIGSGMGYFSLPMARLVGSKGRVVCVDLQEKMIAALMRRAKRAGLSGKIDARICTRDTLGIDDLEERVDFALLFAVIHEVPDRKRLFTEISDALKPGALLLIAEPRGHVRKKEFGETLAIAEGRGLEVVARPAITLSHAALLKKALMRPSAQ